MTEQNSSTAVPLPGRPIWNVERQLRADFHVAVAIVDRSGVAAVLDDVLLNRSAKSGKVVGRPRRITTRAFMVVALLNFMLDGTGEVTSIVRTFNRLPQDLLDALEVRFVAGQVTRDKVDHIWNRIAEACNGSPILDGKRVAVDERGNRYNDFNAARVDPKALNPELTAEDLESSPTRSLSTRGMPRDLSQEQLDERRRRLEHVTDSLLQATIPAELDHGLWAIDWTDHEAWARTYRNAKKGKRGVSSADPDAAWGRRHPKGNRISGGTASARGGDRLAGDDRFETAKTEMFFGYIVHLAVTTKAAWPDGPAPELAASMRVSGANDMDGVAPALVAMVDSMQSAGLPVERVLVDRGYSMKSAERWLVPLSDRGVFASFDLPEDAFGRRGTHHGAVLMGGELYCPRMPETLVNRQVPGPSSDRAAFEKYHDDRARMDRYRFPRLGKLKPGLKIRAQCPAERGLVRCPLRTDSMSIPHRGDVPEIHGPLSLDEAPRCCTSSALTVPREVGLGQRQLFPHGSKEWIADYEQRTSVERYNASLKFEQRVRHSDIRVLGHAKNTLMLCFAAVATNIRHLRNWEAETGLRASTLVNDERSEAA